ncbi:MAG: DegT/DnrJ/EryC1/StrS family aminotransferase, partial [Phycisphaerae bacterium]
MQVPLVDLRAQYATIRQEIQAALQRVIDAQAFILGPEVEALEQAVAEYCRCRYAVG